MGMGRVWRLRRRLVRVAGGSERRRTMCLPGNANTNLRSNTTTNTNTNTKYIYHDIVLASARASDSHPEHQHKQLVQLKEAAFSGKPVIDFFNMV